MAAADVELAAVPLEGVVEEAAAQRDREPIVVDESLLVYGKGGKPIQPQPPDHTESRLLIQKLLAEVHKRGDRIKEIKGIEEQLRSARSGANSGNKDVLNALIALRDQRGGVIVSARCAPRPPCYALSLSRPAKPCPLRPVAPQRQKNAIRDELNNCDGARE
jgi:hypothetical protein